MAPSRGRARRAAPDSGSSVKTRRNPARGKKNAEHDNVPDVYQTLIAEASIPEQTPEERPLKRRRVRADTASLAGSVISSRRSESPAPAPSSVPLASKAAPPASHLYALQTVEDSSDSAGSDLEFEDVGLYQSEDNDDDDGFDQDIVIEDVSISLETEPKVKQRTRSNRRPATAADKAHRLLVHKLHILCLLGHCMFVNGRCNNSEAQKRLRSLLPPRAVNFLQAGASKTQYQRNSMFTDGLQQAVAALTGRFRVTASSQQKSEWHVDESAESPFAPPQPVDKTDFIAAARSLTGSQDLGNQLFCTMLRSAGVEARVVCSLQVLPYGSVPKSATPQKVRKPTYYAIAGEQRTAEDLSNASDLSDTSPVTVGRIPPVRRRLGQPSFATSSPTKTPPKIKTKPIRKLAYPVFWVEAFNAAHQKWLAVDPFVTNTIGKPQKIEPPLTYSLNQMSYVIAFEADGAARDVTKRYTKAFNAKTRRQRVEAHDESGSKWWKKTMRVFSRPQGRLDREQVEDAELARKEAQEGLPANVLDFKDHPYYALERHLKRHEVIHPKREVGKVNAGSAKKPRMESVYRRKDVLVCRSADKWYRQGREIKAGEQPIKYVPARRRRDQTPDPGQKDGEQATTGLYAGNQTSLYIPPPVERGRVPRNSYGNLDIYTPSMVPAGGTHIRDPQAARAARLLRIDYADAVTGFSFKGRHGTAVIDGVIVATSFADAVRSTLEGFVEEAIEEQSRARSLAALKRWKRFITGLRIAQRVSAYGDGSEKNTSHEIDNAMDDAAEMYSAGEFIPDPDSAAMPTAGRYSVAELQKPIKKTKPKAKAVDHHDSSDDGDGTYDGGMDSDAGGFVVPSEDVSHADVDEAEQAGGFLPDDIVEHANITSGPQPDDTPARTDAGGGFLVENNGEDDMAGGFLPASNDDTSMAGGFIPEDVDETGVIATTQAINLVLTPEKQIIDQFAPQDDITNDGADLEDAGSPMVTLVDPDIDDQDENDVSTHEGDSGVAQNSNEVHHTSASDATGAIRKTQDTNPVLDIALTATSELGGAAGTDDEDSILSHDPEDEDAEPDWLESD